MSERETVRIESDGVRTRIFVGDVDISHVVRSVEWFHRDPHDVPHVLLGLRVIEAQVIGGETAWVGLESVPSSVLQRELEIRHGR
jgi:hypothetical protein